MALTLCASRFAPLSAGNSNVAPRKIMSANPSRKAHCRRNNCQSESEASSVSGFGERRETSPCNNRRVAGCSFNGSPASPRRFFAYARNSFSILRSGSILACGRDDLPVIRGRAAARPYRVNIISSFVQSIGREYVHIFPRKHFAHDFLQPVQALAQARTDGFGIQLQCGA